MTLRFFRPPIFGRLFFSDAVFNSGRNKRTISLTFDDGPDPGSTPELLEKLNSHGIKVIFFCQGAKAEKYPNLIRDIRSNGHIIGNHGYYHLNGYRTGISDYIENVRKADRETSSTIFRPPYGKITLQQYLSLKKSYKIVMWDLMPYDFDPRFSSREIIAIIRKKSRNGSLIVLHDTPDSLALQVLDEIIMILLQKGFSFTLPL